MKRKARDIYFMVRMQDGTIIEDVKRDSKWTFDQHQAYWERKAWHEKTSVKQMIFSVKPLTEFDKYNILN